MPVNVSLVVSTFGSDEWHDQGRRALRAVTVTENPFEAFAHHDPDGTLASARNHAAEAARGDFLLYLDADDGIGDGYLDAMEEAASESIYLAGLDPPEGKPLDPERTLFIPSVQYVQDGNCVGAPTIPGWGRPLIDLNCCSIGTLYPRKFFLELGGFREQLADGTALSALEDWDLALRAVLAGATLVPVPDAVYCAARRPGSRNADQSLAGSIRAEHEAAWRARP